MAADPQNYSDLQAAIAAWMQDTTLTSVLPQMIALGERRLSRRLNTPDMEATATLTITNGVAPLPADLMELRGIYIEYDKVRTNLAEMSQSDFDNLYTTDYTGRPMHFTVQAGNIRVRPLPDLTYPISITYKRKLPPLSDANPTNWLLMQHSDLYLFNSIAVSEFFGWNDARLPMLKGWVDELIDEVNKAGQSKRYGVGPLVARAPVSDSRVYGWRR